MPRCMKSLLVIVYAWDTIWNSQKISELKIFAIFKKFETDLKTDKNLKIKNPIRHAWDYA